MPWNLRLIGQAEVERNRLQVGDTVVFDKTLNVKPEDEYDWLGWFCEDKKLSEHYRRDWQAVRGPILVWMPNKTWFCVDGACWRTPQPGGKLEYYGGWTVTGDVETLTVSPSINMGGSYHGWIQNGVITDDCEGRTFPTTL